MIIETKKDEQIIKIVLIVNILVSLHILISFIWNFLIVYFQDRNPLIPTYLIDYIRFPLYFIVPLFSVILFYCVRSLILKQLNSTFIISLLIFIFAFFIYQSQVYLFIQSFSPYASHS